MFTRWRPTNRMRELRSCASVRADGPGKALPLSVVRPEIFRLDDEISHVHRTADTVEMPLAGSIFCQADVASAKNFFGAAAAAHLDLQLTGGDDSDLIDDTRMKIHPPVFPAQHTETRDPSRRAPLVACVRKRFGEL